MPDIVWKPKAVRQLERVKDRIIRSMIFTKVDELKNYPLCTGIKHLSNHKFSYRLRVGNYRVLFDYVKEIKIISIEEVKKRDEQTY